jgi:hypothetical protein
VLHRRDDVPVAEVPAALVRDDGERAAALEVDGAALDRIDRRPVLRVTSIPKWNARDFPEIRGSLK